MEALPRFLGGSLGAGLHAGNYHTKRADVALFLGVGCRRERVALPEVGLATWRYLREGRGRGACLGHGDCVEGGPRCRKHLRSNLTLDVEEYGSRRGTDGVETIAEQALDVSSRVVPINTYSNVSRRTRAFRAAPQPGAACRAVGGPVLARRPHDPAVSTVSDLSRAHRNGAGTTRATSRP